MTQRGERAEGCRIRFLFRLEQKQATRGLYERTFGDSRAYTDYYYQEKCRDNVIVIKEETDLSADPADGVGTILTMAHLNPYLLSVCGLPVRVFMVAAVATEKTRRREGHMRDVLNAAFDWLAEQGVPFVILLPVDPEIYRPFGFETVCAFTEREPAQPELAEDYDVYCIRDLADRDRRAMAQAAEEAAKASGEADEGWPEDPVIMARVTEAAAFDRMAGQSFADDAGRLAWLRSLRICISDGV